MITGYGKSNMEEKLKKLMTEILNLKESGKKIFYFSTIP